MATVAGRMYQRRMGAWWNPLAWLPQREVTDAAGRVYLRRWRLLRLLGWSLVVHQFVGSDYAEDPHDHPWWYASLMLRGGYWEWDARGRRRWYGPGALLRRPAGWAHRVELKPGTEAWTLMLRGPWKRAWGFHSRCGWQHWKPYVEKLGRGLPICEDDEPR